MKSPDLRHPFVFDIRTLSRRPGAMVTSTRTVDALDELGTEIIAIPAGNPVEIAVRFESVLEGVLVSGTVQGRASGACVRCLEAIEQPVKADFQELFVYADRAAHHREVGDDGDHSVLLDDLVDVETLVRDAVVPALPFQPVCRPDCPGLCSDCGASLAADPDHRHETLDPRWAALQQLSAHPDPIGETEKRT